MHPIARIMQESQTELYHIINKVRTLQTLNKVLHEFLDHKFRPYCYVANLENDILVIGITNAAVATIIKFNTPEILAALQHHPAGSKISKIKCRVLPTSDP